MLSRPLRENLRLPPFSSAGRTSTFLTCRGLRRSHGLCLVVFPVACGLSHLLSRTPSSLVSWGLTGWAGPWGRTLTGSGLGDCPLRRCLWCPLLAELTGATQTGMLPARLV